MQHETLYRPSYSLLKITLSPGDLAAVDLRGQAIYAQSGAYIASSPDVQPVRTSGDLWP